MSDLFHEQIPDAFIDRVFKRMQLARQHIFQILTKRPQRMREYLTSRIPVPWGGFSFPEPWGRHIWVGVSVEDQRTADERIPLLLETPAAVRFLSCEPLLGPITFPLPCHGSRFWGGLHWIIVGGESGPGYRPMDYAWVAPIKAACDAARVAYFFKQRSDRRPGRTDGVPPELLVQEFPDTLAARRGRP